MLSWYCFSSKCAYALFEELVRAWQSTAHASDMDDGKSWIYLGARVRNDKGLRDRFCSGGNYFDA
jgi:hypothetical protein